MITEHGKETISEFIKRSIVFAEVEYDDKKIKIPITKKEKQDDGSVMIYVTISPEEEKAVRIKKIRLIDNSGEIFTEHTADIEIAQDYGNALYRYSFKIKEEE